MGEKEDTQEINGGLVCLTLILITAVGAIAGGTLVLTVVTYISEEPEPIVVIVGGSRSDDGSKPGMCPSTEGRAGICILACSDDTDCQGIQKCCYNGCGRTCVDPYIQIDDGIYDERVWTIHNAYYDTASNYLDEESGQIKGFNIDVINEVCHIANKNCQLIRDNFRNAWSNGLGGHGLLAGWYDAAQGWFITYPRVRTFLHTEQFAKAERSLFVVAKGNPTGFDWQDLTNRKIAFYQGWYSDPRCLRRYSDELEGLPLREEGIIVKASTQDVIDAVTSGEADAAFVGRDLTDIVDTLEQVGPYLDRCTLGGASLMARKDSHLPDWWNPAWRRLLNSPKHDELCDRIDTEHNLFGQSSRDFCLTR